MNRVSYICVVLCLGFGLSATASSEPLGETLVAPGVAVVRCAEGTEFVEELADPSVRNSRLGQLRDGLVEVAAMRTVVFDVDRRTVRLEPGAAQLRVEDTVSVCVWQGSASVVGFGSVEAGQCARWARGSSDWGLEELADDALTSAGMPRLLEDHRIGLRYDDDPWPALESLRTEAETRGQGEGGEGANVETSGAAACLESTSGGSEATGPEGPEIPETEIDRAFHRVNLTVTLEGM